MIDLILQSTQLPNLHPALIHFPIAVLPVALAFDAVSLVPALRRRRVLDVATPVLYVLAALGAWASAWSGGEAEHSLPGLPRSVRYLIHEHEEWAERFLYTVAVLAVVRLALAWWWSRREGRGDRPVVLALRGLVLAGGLAAIALLVATADRGGGLVYRAGVAVMAVPAPEEGGGGTVASGGTLIVANKAEATVSLLDARSGEVRATLPTGTGPHEVAVSPDGRLAAIADYGTGEAPGSTLTVIDVAAARVVRTIDLGEYRRPHGMAWFAADRLYVTSEASRALLEVDPEAGSIRRAIETGQEISHMVVVTPDGARAFVANIGSGTVTAIDLAAGKKLADVATGEGAEGIAVGAGRVWVANRAADRVSAIDPGSLEVVATVTPGTFPIRAEVTPDGRWVLVSNAQSGTISVIDAASAEVARTIELGVRANEGEGRLLEFGDESPVPIGIEIAPDGKRAWVAAANADAIVVLDLEAWQPAGTVTAGREPDGMGYSLVEVEPAADR
jgi:YVTN family beta-propeller protein